MRPTRPHIRLVSDPGVAAARPDAGWQLWPGRNWPATTADEARFLDDLTAASGADDVPFRRGDVTAVLNALRCGVHLDDLRSRAPGLHPERLLAAYRHLDARRSVAAGAWDAIVADPSFEALAEWGDEAERLVGLVVASLRQIAADGSADALRWCVQHYAAQVDATQARLLELEAELDACVPPSERGVRVGRLVYDLHDPGVTGEDAFVARRVGTLVPMRVAALLDGDGPLDGAVRAVPEQLAG